ncbi:MAG: energy-coupling factor ABC transporter permease [Rhodocyclaceae bacterium]|nr:energy-coupling factor ABC transporter permease [Rhodocyclaceae bacterium]
MNFSAGLFPDAWLWSADALALAVLVWSLRSGPWRSLGQSGRLNLWLGMGVLLMLVWRMKAGVNPGLDLHMLGAMVATLVFGPQLAVGVLGLTLAGVTFNSGASWHSFALNWLVMAVVPVLFANTVRRVVEHVLPRHFFIFVFVIAFFGSALTVLLQGVVASLVLVAAGAYSFEFLAANYLPYFLLLGFAEAWMSGMAVTLMVVYRPGWVTCFDDRIYLRNK